MDTAPIDRHARATRTHRLIAAGMTGALVVAAATIAITGDDDAPETLASVETSFDPTTESTLLSESSAPQSAPTSTPATPATAVPADPDTDPPAEVVVDVVAGEDSDPEPGAVPGGLVPLDTSQAAPVAGPAFDPVQVPFARVDTPAAPAAQAAPAPVFVPVELPTDPQPHLDPEPGGLHLTAATGCANRCIVGATMSGAGGTSPHYVLTVELDTNAAMVDVYLSPIPIERNDDGGHVPPFSVPTTSGYTGLNSSTWSKTFELEPETDYHVLVRATDDQGTSSAAGTFTTADAPGPDQFVAPRPCDDGCIDDFTVETAADGTSITIGLTATADATIEYATSHEQFTQTDDGPTLPGATPATVETAAGSRSTLGLLDRTPNTAYSVLITATDSLGGVDTWIARVATPSPIVLVGIDRVHISGDGDDGRLDDGEITFSFGASDGHWGHRGEEKLSSNTTVRLGRSAGKALEADGSGRYPSVRVFAGERDGTSLRSCFVEANPDGGWGPVDTVTWCNNARTTWSSTYVPSMTLAEIQALPTCAQFGLDHPADARCAWVHTSPNSSDQVSFDMIVTYRLAPAG